MFEILTCSLMFLLRKRFRKKKSTYQIPLHIILNNLMPTDNKSHVKGTISLCHLEVTIVLCSYFVLKVFTIRM